MVGDAMRLILFDIDLTLIDPAGAGRRSMELAFEELFGIPRAFEETPFAGLTDRAILWQTLTHHGLLDDHGRVRWAGEAMPFPEVVPRFVTVYARHLAEVLPTRPGRVLPGVPALLSRLQEAPATVLGVATGNFRLGAQLKLGHYDLRSFFAGGGYGDEHLDRAGLIVEAMLNLDGRRHAGTKGEKPVAEASLQETGAHSGWSRVVVVGDTPYDIGGGHAVGAVTVGVASGFHSQDQLAAAGADLVFPDLANVEQVAASLLAA